LNDPAVLLLDFDHTLYPSTLGTLKAVDERINLYMQTYLGLSRDAADALRVELWDKYGTTLKGLEVLYGVERHHYCDFIHAIAEEHLPPPDPALQDWLARLPHPVYLFTNARLDWAVRGMKAMGLEGLLPEAEAAAAKDAVAALDAAARDLAGPDAASGGSAGARRAVPPGRIFPRRLEGIFDIAFMDWEGKPNPGPYAKVDAHVRARHGAGTRIYFADDRMDNLESARAQGWTTIWIHPHTAGPVRGDEFDRVAPALTRLDPLTLG
jgi:pyrimidine 5'-nucleotidase